MLGIGSQAFVEVEFMRHKNMNSDKKRPRDDTNKGQLNLMND